MASCKITVVKRTLIQEVADEHLGPDAIQPCHRFTDGQEFTVSSPSGMPENFGCSWAWSDIYPTLVSVWGKNDDHCTIACCTDGYRPVIFKIELIEGD